MEITSVSDDGPGLTTDGFSTFSSGKVAFPAPVGDGVGTGSCSATQYCATQFATNNTGVLMDNMYVEITKYTTVTPTGAKVTWAGTPAPTSSAFKSYFVNSTIEAANYGNFTVGQSKSIEWKFNLDAGSAVATDFEFTAATYASFRRTGGYSGAFKTATSGVDACTASGHTTVSGLTGQDDAEATVALPFPFTLYDVTYDQAVIGSNGYVLFFQTGASTPTMGATNYVNTAMTTSTPIGLFPFWDDLMFDAADGVCTSVSGSKGNRLFSITWKNAHINTNAGTPQSKPGTKSAEQVTYSLTILETVDQFSFAYNLPSGGITDLTRGISANSGERAIKNGAPYIVHYKGNGVDSPYIPAASASYPSRIFKLGLPSNP